jgi:hypothetical protein
MKRATVCLIVVAAFSHVTATQAPVVRELSLAWSLQGRWSGVVGDEQSGAIYAGGPDRIAEIDLEGQIRREFKPSPGRGMMLRLGKFPRSTLLTFYTWAAQLTAYDLSGNRLWSYPRDTGIDDVWAGDVDGDGSDEVVVGYNGRGGVHVLDAKGQLRWKSTDIGNVWHVAVGDALGQGKPQVVTTSGKGGIHIFSGDGSARSDIATERVYANMVRVGKLRPEDGTATILVTGPDMARTNTNSQGDTVTALSGGATLWRLELPGKVHAASVASAKPWLALGTRDGQVFVVDAVKGEMIGGVAGQGSLAEVGWVGNPPLLLVATGDSLNAFRVNAK